VLQAKPLCHSLQAERACTGHNHCIAQSAAALECLLQNVLVIRRQWQLLLEDLCVQGLCSWMGAMRPRLQPLEHATQPCSKQQSHLMQLDALHDQETVQPQHPPAFTRIRVGSILATSGISSLQNTAFGISTLSQACCSKMVLLSTATAHLKSTSLPCSTTLTCLSTSGARPSCGSCRCRVDSKTGA
jgi:hypothetical protein